MFWFVSKQFVSKSVVFGFMKQTETQPKQILFRFVSVRIEIFLFCFEDTLYLGAFPAVVVSGVAAHVDHGVEGGGAAPDAPPRPVHHAVVAVLLRQGVVEPVVPIRGRWSNYRPRPYSK